MKQVTNDLYCIEVPIEATKFKISGTNWFCIKPMDEWIAWEGLEGKFKILGEVTESEISFDVEPYIEKDSSLGTGNFFIFYGKVYDKEHHRLLSTTNKNESFRSLLQSKGIFWVNPIEKPKVPWEDAIMEEGLHDRYKLSYDKWQESESKVVKGKLIILKKI